MTRLITLLSLGLAAACLPQLAAAQSAPQDVPLDAGFYDVTAVVSGYEFLAGTFEKEICVRPGENDETLKELILVSTDKKLRCEHSNVIWTTSTLQADVLCRMQGSSDEIPGSISAQFRSDFLKMSSTSQITPEIRLQTDTTISRKGECPVDWVETDLF